MGKGEDAMVSVDCSSLQMTKQKGKRTNQVCAEEPSWGSKTWKPREDLDDEEGESELEVIENTPFQSDHYQRGREWESMIQHADTSLTSAST